MNFQDDIKEEILEEDDETLAEQLFGELESTQQPTFTPELQSNASVP